MEIGITVRLQIVRTADAGVSHDGRAAAGFEGRRRATTAGAPGGTAIEGMRSAELMAHLMRDIIDPEGIAGWRINAGLAEGFAAGDAGDTNTSHATTSRAEDVANVVI